MPDIQQDGQKYKALIRQGTHKWKTPDTITRMTIS